MRRAIGGFTMLLSMLGAGSVAAEVVAVDSTAQLLSAIADAEPGDEIVLAAGTYAVGQNVRCNASGTDAAPIVVRAARFGDAVIEFDAVEGFVVAGAHWQFEDLVVRGVCAADSDCEHAFHVVGPGDDVVIRNNRVVNFNAHVKSNGSGDPRVWPDRGLIEANEFYNEAVRATSSPVTPLDLVGGDDWVVRRNFIHDFAKGEGNNISYAAFLKGKSRRGVFERNLVACEHLHQGHVRLGLSFGGGLTGDQFCEGGDCTPEHIDGVMQNNIIANCPADVGIYIAEAENALIQFNTVVNTAGIDLRFAATSAVVANNLLDGRIRDRNGATSVQVGNVVVDDLDALFADVSALDFGPRDVASVVDAADPGYVVADDYCGTLRSGALDVGAIEYSVATCDTSTPWHNGLPPGDDVGTDPDVDAGSRDAGDPGQSTVDVGNGGTAAGDDVGVPGGPADTDAVKPLPEESGCGCSHTNPKSTVVWGVLMLGVLVRRRLRS